LYWEDLLIDRELTAEEQAATLADLFGVGRADVLVFESGATPEGASAARVLCERGAVGGDFPARLSVYVDDDVPKDAESRPLVEQFCRRLNCSCLISDDSPNPYSMLLVRPDGATQRVYLDTERLDEHDEYVIDRPAEEDEKP
jgi:hypothetical protein